MERLGETVFVVDQGSQNGTEVNGEAVRRRPLAEGDVIQLGRTKICFGRIAPLGSSGHETAVLEAFDQLADDTSMEEVARERDNLLALQKINQAINSERALRPLLDLIVDSAITLTRAERGFLILGREGSVRFEVARNFAREPVEMPELKISRSITARVREEGKPLLSLNAKEDERFRDFASVENLSLLSVICLPIRIKGRVEGVLYVDNRLQEGIFSESDLVILEAMAEQAGIAIENAKLFSQLQETNARLREQSKRIEQLNQELGRRVEDQETELQAAREALVRERGSHPYPEVIGESPAMKAVFRLLDRVVPTDFPVLIEGESGTGKELIARAVHANGPRQKMPFVTENCAALSDSLLESELFGHTKGAFTGAHRTRKGLLELADGGTLFLDEVGEMSGELQRKLLRFLQEGDVRPVGSDKVIRTNVRIVSASNRRLEALVRSGKFREDLYYRLNVLRIELPPLRDRKADLPRLLDHFLQRAAKETGLPSKRIAPEAMACLERYAWPGNVRELENEVRKWAVLDGAVVDEAMVSPPIREAGFLPSEGGEEGNSLPDRVRQVEIRAIREALAQARGNKSQAAQILGLSRFALQRKIDKLLIEGAP